MFMDLKTYRLLMREDSTTDELAGGDKAEWNRGSLIERLHPNADKEDNGDLSERKGKKSGE